MDVVYETQWHKGSGFDSQMKILTFNLFPSEVGLVAARWLNG